MRRVRSALRRSPLLRDLPREVAVLTAVAFCVALGFGILAPALPVFAREFDVSMLAASSVISVFALMRFVTSPLAGWMVDRIGERTVLASGLLIVALSSAAAGLSQSFAQLLVLRGAGGLGSSMFTVSAMAMLLRVTEPDQRGRASGAFQGGFLIGGIAGPAVGGIVVAWSIRAPFFVYAATLLAAVIVTLISLTRVRLREREETVGGSHTEESASLAAAFRDRAYRAALAVNLATGFVTFGMRSSVVPIFVTEGLQRGASLTGIGFLVTAAIQGALLLPAGRIADTEGRRKALMLGTWGLAVGMVVLTATDVATNGLGTASVVGTALFLASMAIQGAASAFLGSAPSAVVGDIVGGRKGGAVVAAYQMTSDLGAVIGPLLAGFLVDISDFEWAFAAGTALVVVAGILVSTMPETLRRSPSA